MNCPTCGSEYSAVAEPRTPTIDAILHAVQSATGVLPEQVLSDRRQAKIALARHIAQYVARRTTTLTLHEIGTALNRSHCSVVNSVAKITRTRSVKPETDRLVKLTLRILEAWRHGHDDAH